MLIKVCGMKDGDNIRAVEQLGADLIGFIFYPRSPRFVDTLPDYLPTRAKRVGVFVNETKENVLMYADRFGLHYAQLHGAESPGYCRSIRRQGLAVIKAFAISTPEDIYKVEEYEETCDYFLFDTPSPHHGGSGKAFDWSLLASYRGHTPFLLSGGIGPQSLEALKDFRHSRLAGYDLNSRFEIHPGLKDVESLKLFTQNL